MVLLNIIFSYFLFKYLVVRTRDPQGTHMSDGNTKLRFKVVSVLIIPTDPLEMSRGVYFAQDSFPLAPSFFPPNIRENKDDNIHK